MATSKRLDKAVEKETAKAEEKAKTGNVKTEEAPAPAETVDLPTGTRRSLPSE